MNEEQKQNGTLEDTLAAEETALPEEADTAAIDDEDDEYEEPEEVVFVTTQITGDLLDLMTDVMMRQVKPGTRRNTAIVAVVAAVAGIACLAAGQTTIGFVLWVVAVVAAYYWSRMSAKAARSRLGRSEGLQWDYVFDKAGIHVGTRQSDPAIGWGAVKRAWLERGCYIFEVQNSSVVVKQDSLSGEDRNTLELLMLEHVQNCTLS
jgi:hypothetical protein